MQFFDHLAEFFMTPSEEVIAWFDQLAVDLGSAADSWWSNLWASLGMAITPLIIEGIAICVIGYGVYCSFRIMCTVKDEVFSEYINKTLIAGLAYFFARCGGNIILKMIGA